MKNLIITIATTATLLSFAGTNSFADQNAGASTSGECVFFGIKYSCKKVEYRYKKQFDTLITIDEISDDRGGNRGGGRNG